jgi:hypothetical protein
MHRSYLFAPGHNAKLLGKVFDASADAVMLDLEDAVPAHHKDTARAMVADVLAERDGWVRIPSGLQRARRISMLLPASPPGSASPRSSRPTTRSGWPTAHRARRSSARSRAPAASSPPPRSPACPACATSRWAASISGATSTPATATCRPSTRAHTSSSSRAPLDSSRRSTASTRSSTTSLAPRAGDIRPLTRLLRQIGDPPPPAAHHPRGLHPHRARTRMGAGGRRCLRQLRGRRPATAGRRVRRRAGGAARTEDAGARRSADASVVRGLAPGFGRPSRAPSSSAHRAGRLERGMPCTWWCGCVQWRVQPRRNLRWPSQSAGGSSACRGFESLLRHRAKAPLQRGLWLSRAVCGAENAEGEPVVATATNRYEPLRCVHLLGAAAEPLVRYCYPSG